MSRLPLCWIVLILGFSSNALALKPGTHADITKESCRAAGLHSDFCLRAATENYNTDAREWEDMRAHAQIDGDQTACVAADQTAQRLWTLGDELRTVLSEIAANDSADNVGRAAAALGRTLHTIQDNCAHDGMPNPQHAWFSMSDFCEDTHLSPDVRPEATECARAETDAVIALVASAVKAAGVQDALEEGCTGHPNDGPRGVCHDRFLPGAISACDFLAAAGDWDGEDRRWDSSIVVPALRGAFATGLRGEPALEPICAGDETTLSRVDQQPTYDVSDGPASCKRASLFCLGKADEAEHPFADDPEPAGCRAAGGQPSAPWLLGLCLILFVQIRRTRRKRR